MDSRETELKENYERNLKATEYNEKFNRIFNQIRGNFEFILQFLHDVTMSGRFAGSKVLDIGCGATVHNIASISSRFSNIVQSDYVLDNVEELRRWHQGLSSLDWSQFLNLVTDIERNSGHLITREALEIRIRENVSCVVQGDLLSDTVLPLEELKVHNVSPPFDVIISVLCIETVATNLNSYLDILKKLNKLLRPAGGLLLCGYENGSSWIVGENTFNHVKLNLEQIMDALKMAGFKCLDVRIKKKMESEYNYHYDSLFCVVAEKN